MGKVKELADKAGVGFSIVYEESANTWYGTSDKFVGKSKSFEGAIEDLSDYLKNYG